nr:TatC [Picochlorum sp. 'soloecismus']
MVSGYGYAICIAWWYKEAYVYIYGFLCRRLGIPLVALDIGESLRVYIHITVYMALLFWLYLCMYHIWCFLAPGLYAYEARFWWYTWCRWIVYIVLLYMVGLYYIWPKIGSYLLTLSPQTSVWGQGIVHYPRVYSYIYWALYTPLIVVVCGSIPYGIMVYGTQPKGVYILARWRYMWIWCTCLGVSLVVPPYPLFQCVATCILWALYECIIVYVCICTSPSKVKSKVA